MLLGRKSNRLFLSSRSAAMALLFVIALPSVTVQTAFGYQTTPDRLSQTNSSRRDGQSPRRSDPPRPQIDPSTFRIKMLPESSPASQTQGNRGQFSQAYSVPETPPRDLHPPNARKISNQTGFNSMFRDSMVRQTTAQLPIYESLQQPSPSNVAPPQNANPSYPTLEMKPYESRNTGNDHRYEVLPAPPTSLQNVQLIEQDGKVTLVARDALLTEVLSLLADQYQLNFVFASNIEDRVTISLRGVHLEHALNSVLAVAGYSWSETQGIIHITSLSTNNTTQIAPEFSGCRVRVFQLDYVSAVEIDKVVKGMLSSIGKSYVSESDINDNRRTSDSVVVEDLPGSIARIEQYIAQVDVPPRQVLIEAHVLEVELDESDRRGVNFEKMASISGHQLKFGVMGDDPSGTSTFFAELSSDSLKGVIDALQTKVNSKTLASPKILALNGQVARIQVGQQLGFRVVTTTQTSTLEDVRFLDVGIVLSVTPRISRDGRVMLQVKPEVSSGTINPDTGLPEEETSEVETNVMLSNGTGMIIGGLIQETESDVQTKVPHLGDKKFLGSLFRRTTRVKKRSEIIFVLMPRIIDAEVPGNSVPFDLEHANYRDQIDVRRASTTLIDSCLNCTPRPLESKRRALQHEQDDVRQYEYGFEQQPIDQGYAPTQEDYLPEAGMMAPQSTFPAPSPMNGPLSINSLQHRQPANSVLYRNPVRQAGYVPPIYQPQAPHVQRRPSSNVIPAGGRFSQSVVVPSTTRNDHR